MCVDGTNKYLRLSNWGSPNPKSITSLGLQPPRGARSPALPLYWKSHSPLPVLSHSRKKAGKGNWITFLVISPHLVVYIMNSGLAILYALLIIHSTKILEWKIATFLSQESDSLKIMGLGFQIVASLVFSKNPFRNWVSCVLSCICFLLQGSERHWLKWWRTEATRKLQQIKISIDVSK